jgi:hypothetical protein
LKPAQENNLQDPISKKPFTKIGLVEWLKGKALSSSPSTGKKKEINTYIIKIIHDSSIYMCVCVFPSINRA